MERNSCPRTGWHLEGPVEKLQRPTTEVSLHQRAPTSLTIGCHNPRSRRNVPTFRIPQNRNVGTSTRQISDRQSLQY